MRAQEHSQLDGTVDYSKDFFNKPTNLTVSGQLNGETYAMAFKNIYTFGPTFRAENSNTTRHAAEFWMIEPEIAFADLKDDMMLAEWNISPAPSQSLPVIIGVCTYTKSLSWKNL